MLIPLHRIMLSKDHSIATYNSLFHGTEAMIQFERETYFNTEGASIVFVAVISGGIIQSDATFRFTTEDRTASGMSFFPLLYVLPFASGFIVLFCLCNAP